MDDFRHLILNESIGLSSSLQVRCRNTVGDAGLVPLLMWLNISPIFVLSSSPLVKIYNAVFAFVIFVSFMYKFLTYVAEGKIKEVDPEFQYCNSAFSAELGFLQLRYALVQFM